MKEKVINLRQLINTVNSAMSDLNYTDNSMRHYHEIWQRYLKITEYMEYNRDDALLFLKNIYDIDENNKKLTRYQRNAKRAIEVLDYYAKFEKIYIRFPLSNPVTVETPIDEQINTFIDYLKNNKYAPSTIHCHERVLSKFALSLKDSDVTTVNRISPKNISQFIRKFTCVLSIFV